MLASSTKAAWTARVAASPRSTVPRATCSDDGFIVRPRENDLAGFFERPDHAHDRALRLLDRLEADRPEQLDLLVEVLRRALRHVLHDLLAHDVLDAFQRDGEVLGVDLAQDELH